MFGTHEGGLRHVVGGADGGGDDLDRMAEVVVLDCRDDVVELVEAILGDVIEAAHEGADVAGARACREPAPGAR